MSADDFFQELLFTNQPGQSGFKSLHGVEAVDQDHALAFTFEKFEAMCGARDKEALLFVAAPGGFNQDEAMTVIIIAGADIPILLANPRDGSNDLRLLRRNAVQSGN